MSARCKTLRISMQLLGELIKAPSGIIQGGIPADATIQEICFDRRHAAIVLTVSSSEFELADAPFPEMQVSYRQAVALPSAH